MRSHRKTLGVAAALVLAAISCAAPADAVPMVQGDTVYVTFPAPSQNTNLAASAVVTLTTLTSSSAIFDVSVTNGTSILGDPGAHLTAFGFLFSPTPTANSNIALTDTGGITDTDAFLQGTTPDNIPSFNSQGNTPENVCIWAGNNCNGGSNNGLADGETDKFRFTLDGSFSGSVDLSNFGIKWQACEGCSFEILGTTTNHVPEPAAFTLFVAGGLTLFLIGRVRRSEA